MRRALSKLGCVPSRKKSSSHKKHGESIDESKTVEYYRSKREHCCKSPLECDFNKSRIKILNGCTEIRDLESTVMYWMNRDQRVQDNWALIFAQRLAAKYEIPLRVCFCLDKSYMNYSFRHYDFLIKGLELVHIELSHLNIPFHVVLGDPVTNVLDLVSQNNVSALITDFCPIDPPKRWINQLRRSLPNDVSLCLVDAHNIIPAWITSDKREYAARTIRPKIRKLLDEYLTEFPPIIKHQWNKSAIEFPAFVKDSYYDFVKENEYVDPIDWAQPGYAQGLVCLEDFIIHRLPEFAFFRNNAASEGTSNLSPWLHFGHLSAQRAILRVMDFIDEYKKHVDVFVEEALIRRELSENYCLYTEEPSDPSSAPTWAIETLNKHMEDKRPYIYNLDQLEKCSTHDPIWNAAQNQLKTKGKMSGYLRMYWAKKILEWSRNASAALANSLYLNDKYSIDGNDCNGIVGCMWAIYGVHDRAWAERKVFGKVRFMSEVGCNRQFNVKEYIEKYGINV
ncbi:hypothetical protein HZS_876 [Henneguya salminicola]|nr:hypothetical protein HZS_876 [Henneguya salminicola]